MTTGVWPPAKRTDTNLDSPPYKAHSELGSVLLAKAGSDGPTASSHSERAKVPRRHSARMGPTKNNLELINM